MRPLHNWIVHYPPKVKVAGSNPAGRTKNFKSFKKIKTFKVFDNI